MPSLLKDPCTIAQYFSILNRTDKFKDQASSDLLRSFAYIYSKEFFLNCLEESSDFSLYVGGHSINPETNVLKFQMECDYFNQSSVCLFNLEFRLAEHNETIPYDGHYATDYRGSYPDPECVHAVLNKTPHTYLDSYYDKSAKEGCHNTLTVFDTELGQLWVTLKYTSVYKAGNLFTGSQEDLKWSIREEAKLFLDRKGITYTQDMFYNRLASFSFTGTSVYALDYFILPHGYRLIELNRKTNRLNFVTIELVDKMDSDHKQDLNLTTRKEVLGEHSDLISLLGVANYRFRSGCRLVDGDDTIMYLSYHKGDFTTFIKITLSKFPEESSVELQKKLILGKISVKATSKTKYRERCFACLVGEDCNELLLEQSTPGGQMGALITFCTADEYKAVASNPGSTEFMMSDLVENSFNFWKGCVIDGDKKQRVYALKEGNYTTSVYIDASGSQKFYVKVVTFDLDQCGLETIFNLGNVKMTNHEQTGATVSKTEAQEPLETESLENIETQIFSTQQSIILSPARAAMIGSHVKDNAVSPKQPSKELSEFTNSVDALISNDGDLSEAEVCVYGTVLRALCRESMGPEAYVTDLKKTQQGIEFTETGSGPIVDANIRVQAFEPNDDLSHFCCLPERSFEYILRGEPRLGRYGLTDFVSTERVWLKADPVTGVSEYVFTHKTGTSNIYFLIVISRKAAVPLKADAHHPKWLEFSNSISEVNSNLNELEREQHPFWNSLFINLSESLLSQKLDGTFYLTEMKKDGPAVSFGVANTKTSTFHSIEIELLLKEYVSRYIKTREYIDPTRFYELYPELEGCGLHKVFSSINSLPSDSLAIKKYLATYRTENGVEYATIEIYKNDTPSPRPNFRPKETKIMSSLTDKLRVSLDAQRNNLITDLIEEAEIDLNAVQQKLDRKPKDESIVGLCELAILNSVAKRLDRDVSDVVFSLIKDRELLVLRATATNGHRFEDRLIKIQVEEIGAGKEEPNNSIHEYRFEDDPNGLVSDGLTEMMESIGFAKVKQSVNRLLHYRARFDDYGCYVSVFFK